MQDIKCYPTLPDNVCCFTYTIYLSNVPQGQNKKQYGVKSWYKITCLY